VELAIVDTCFLINWAKFRQKNDIFNIFSKLIIPSIIYTEVRSGSARSFIARLMAEKRILLAPRISQVDILALKIYDLINSHPSLPSIDPPEAYALALAKYLEKPLLTDNASPRLAVEVINEVKGVRVYDSLMLLAKLYKGNLFRRKVKEFIEDTHIFFSEKRLREYGL